MELRLINEFTESNQYRTTSAIKQTDARIVCDHAFMDMIALWILYNEFEYAPQARKYAERTATFNRFANFRQMGTDLYLSLHLITAKRTDLLSSEADTTLLDRIELDVPTIIRYLRAASQNVLNTGMARMTLQRLENALYINNSNYRSIRRLAQNWPSLTTNQKRTVLTRMVFFYRAHARRSEIGALIATLAKTNGLLDPNAKSPEGNSALKTAAAMAAAATVGGALGYRLGKSLV
jgi:hypothetical protein